MKIELKLADVEITLEHTDPIITIGENTFFLADLAYLYLDKMLKDRVSLDQALTAEPAEDADGDKPEHKDNNIIPHGIIEPAIDRAMYV